MKKSWIYFILGLGITASASYGQGTILFQSYISPNYPAITYNSNSGNNAGLALGGDFAAELAYYPGITTAQNLLTLDSASITGFGVVTSAWPNSVADGDVASGAGWFFGPALSLPGTSPGQVVTLEVYVFDNGIGYGTWGSSGLFSAMLGGAEPGTLSNMPSFAIGPLSPPMPEPATLALAGLSSLISLVAFRRVRRRPSK